MSIRERLEDAQVLWNNDRRQGAWIQVLIAAAATSKLRFAQQSDGDAFRQFIREVTPTIVEGVSPAVPGGIRVILNAESLAQIELAQVVYKHLRCNLLHEAVMPADVRLSESRMVDGKLVADFQGGSPLVIPDFWVLHLAKAVASAPENTECAGMFG
jgi:hypothetical protein